ncbi:MAG: addiction module protein [Myxococcota bacterium]|jgi:putative addiction module component (TIGR02574 family)|nr:addiction module protein [Myxococcota bacterium]
MALPSESEIRRLTPQERIRLIELLWLSFVDEPSSLPVTDAQREELRRRLAAHAENPEEAQPWSEVRAELERK